MQKIYNIIVLILLLLFICACAGFGIQSYRLGKYMGECRYYREQLELAENRESEIRENVNRTGLILSETTNTVGELREKLKALEDSYNNLWNMFYDDDNNVHNGEK